jgi:ubiquinone/menaquinone biosynthesis C-methylase UbiE
MDNLQHMVSHFRRVAWVYGHVRNTDPQIIEEIIPRLPGDKPRLNIADIGCGTGRYSKIIVARADNCSRLFCCDYSAAMLQQCRKRMSLEFPFKNTCYCLVNANELPFAHGCFDAITTFNAVHHFDLDRFVAAVARVLCTGGLLTIYTRTPEQNAHTIWGQHFPGFTEQETRLYQCERLEEAIGRVPELQLEGMQEFKHVRVEAVESLLKRARNFHYSTFTLYPADEFRLALETFAKRLADISSKGKIEHTARNTMVLIRRI